MNTLLMRSPACSFRYGLLLAASLLGNKEADLFASQVIEFIQAVTVPQPRKEGEGGEPWRQDQVLVLIDAAKGWIERKHGEEPIRYAVNMHNRLFCLLSFLLLLLLFAYTFLFIFVTARHCRVLCFD